MPGGVALTTLRSVSDWVDLGATFPAVGFAVHMMTVVTEDGAGRACYVQLMDGRDGEVSAFLFDPDLAAQMGWELMGVVNGYSPGAYVSGEEDDGEDEE